MFILIPLHRFFERLDLQYIINYIKIGQVSFIIHIKHSFSNSIFKKLFKSNLGKI